MITFVTVWVLTVTSSQMSYQLQYSTQAICEKQNPNHEMLLRKARCDFQQIPVVK